MTTPKTADQLRTELEESGLLRDRMAALLTGVAAGLKGAPPALTMHDWSDLPELAAAMRGQLHGPAAGADPLPVRWDVADLVAPSDIADQCGVGKPAVSNWIARYPDFPKPIVTVAQGTTALFSRKAVIDWYDRKTWMHDGPGSKSKRH